MSFAGTILRSRAVAALTSPHGVDRYLEQINPMWAATEVRARVLDVRRETGGEHPVATITLQPTGTWRGHRAGQYVQVGVDLPGSRRTTRCFTISSAASLPGETIQLTVRAQGEARPGQSVSRWLVERAQPGDLVHLSQAEGDFVLDESPATPTTNHLLFLTGGSGINSLSGAAGNDSLIGGTLNDTLDGGSGNDTMAGGAGNDVYISDSATGDAASETAGNGTDTIQTALTSFDMSGSNWLNVENLTYTGTTGNFTGNGGGGSNTITGGAGNDSISGDSTLIARPEDLSSWLSSTRVSVLLDQSGVTAPNGTQTADKFVPYSGSAGIATAFSGAASTQYTFSVYLRAAELNSAFVIVGGTNNNFGYTATLRNFMSVTAAPRRQTARTASLSGAPKSILVPRLRPMAAMTRSSAMRATTRLMAALAMTRWKVATAMIPISLIVPAMSLSNWPPRMRARQIRSRRAPPPTRCRTISRT